MMRPGIHLETPRFLGTFFSAFMYNWRKSEVASIAKSAGYQIFASIFQFERIYGCRYLAFILIKGKTTRINPMVMIDYTSRASIGLIKRVPSGTHRARRHPRADRRGCPGTRPDHLARRLVDPGALAHRHILLCDLGRVRYLFPETQAGRPDRLRSGAQETAKA